MTKRIIGMLGLLVNVDSTIDKLKLKDNYNIISYPKEEGLKLLSTVLGISECEVFKQYCMPFPYFSQDNVSFYFIEKYYRLDEITASTVKSPWPLDKDGQSIINTTQKYLSKLTQLMNLYKEGNICIPNTFFFIFDEDGTRIPSTRFGTTLKIKEGKYTLSEDDITQLENFIENTNLSNIDKPISIALEMFEQSYYAGSLALEFLACMISVEILYHPSDSIELSHQISRNAAVFLGETEEEAIIIFKNIKRLYSQRSKMVHTGDIKKLTRDDLFLARDYIRKSIKNYIKTGKKKTEILSHLNTLGFGQFHI